MWRRSGSEVRESSMGSYAIIMSDSTQSSIEQLLNIATGMRGLCRMCDVNNDDYIFLSSLSRYLLLGRSAFVRRAPAL